MSGPAPRSLVVTIPWGERLGGAENMLFSFLRHVDRSRVDPIPVFFARGTFVSEVAALGFRTLVVDTGRMREGRAFARGVRNLARVLRDARPGLVLNWMAKAQLYGAAAAMAAGLGDRVVWWQHMIPERHWLDRAATALPALAVGCSSHASAAAQQRLRPRRATFVVHPGIDPPLPTEIGELNRLRCELGIPNRAAVVGIAGRLQPWKGQHRFLIAVDLLRRRGHSIHALVVGGDAHGLSPTYTTVLRKLVDERGLEKHVTFTGHVRDASPYLQLMDVFVSATEGEPFGIVLLEAMALGTPVVAVDAGGPSEIVGHERSGLLVRSGEAEELAAGVERLLVDRALGDRVRREAKELVLDRFSARRMTESLLDVVESLSKP